jgi:putative thioredoxin
MAMEPSKTFLQGAVDLSGLVRKNTPLPPSQTAHEATATSALVRDITEAEMAGIVTLSQTVPVILEFYGQGHQPALADIVKSFGGRLVLATIDVATSPELVQGLAISGIPTVFAIIQGRPAPLFQGIPPEDDIRRLFTEVLQVAGQAGVTGQVEPEEDADGGQEPEAQGDSTPDWLTQALVALQENDFDGAHAAYAAGLTVEPKNPEALNGIARVGLLRRIHDCGQDNDTIRREAADNPDALDAQFLVADLDVAGGHLEDAFRRLLALFAAADEEARPLIRGHLVELFDVAGVSHPAVATARQQLTSLLY